MKNLKFKMMYNKIAGVDLYIEGLADFKGFNLENDAIYIMFIKELLIFEEMIKEAEKENYVNSEIAIKWQYENLIELSNKIILRINIFSKN